MSTLFFILIFLLAGAACGVGTCEIERRIRPRYLALPMIALLSCIVMGTCTLEANSLLGMYGDFAFIVWFAGCAIGYCAQWIRTTWQKT